MNGQQLELLRDIDIGDGRLAGNEVVTLQMERLVLVELNQEDGLFVVPRHLDALRVQATGVERSNQIRYRLAFNAYVRREDVIADL